MALLVGELAAGEVAIGVGAGHRTAGAVDDRDTLGLEALDAVGHEELDGADLLVAEGAAGLELTKTLALACWWSWPKSFSSGTTMSTRALADFVELADGAGEFALERAVIIGALHEIGFAKVGLSKSSKPTPPSDIVGIPCEARPMRTV